MKQNLDISAKALKIDIFHIWENFKVKLLLDEVWCVLPEAPATFSCHQSEFIKEQNSPQSNRLFAWIRCDEWNTHMRNIHHTALKYEVAAIVWGKKIPQTKCKNLWLCFYDLKKTLAHGDISSPEMNTS